MEVQLMLAYQISCSGQQSLSAVPRSSKDARCFAAASVLQRGRGVVRQHCSAATPPDPLNAQPHAHPHLPSLVRDLGILKRRLEADVGDSEAEFSLAQLLRALTGCVSALRERKHDALLAEVLGIRLWLVPRVSRAARGSAWGGRLRAAACFRRGACCTLATASHATSMPLQHKPHAPPMHLILTPRTPCQPHATPMHQQDVRAALLEALVNLMVANHAFMHNCMQAMLFSLLPPPGVAAAPDAAGAGWEPTALALEVQGQVLDAVSKVRFGQRVGGQLLRFLVCLVALQVVRIECVFSAVQALDALHPPNCAHPPPPPSPHRTAPRRPSSSSPPSPPSCSRCCCRTSPTRPATAPPSASTCAPCWRWQSRRRGPPCARGCCWGWWTTCSALTLRSSGRTSWM